MADEQDQEQGEAEDLPAEIRNGFMPYPVSRLSPAIVPNDLTSFKSRGISKVEKTLKQQLTELREAYSEIIDAFNWNKLVYESSFSFEPIIGETYHLYEINGQLRLSIIGPDDWDKKFLASLRLDADGRWRVAKVAEDFDLEAYLRKPGNPDG